MDIDFTALPDKKIEKPITPNFTSLPDRNVTQVSGPAPVSQVTPPTATPTNLNVAPATATETPADFNSLPDKPKIDFSSLPNKSPSMNPFHSPMLEQKPEKSQYQVDNIMSVLNAPAKFKDSLIEKASDGKWKSADEFLLGQRPGPDEPKEIFKIKAMREATQIATDPLMWGPAMLRAVASFSKTAKLTAAGLRALREALPVGIESLKAEDQMHMIKEVTDSLKGSANAKNYFQEAGLSLFGKNVLPMKKIEAVTQNPAVRKVTDPIRKVYESVFGGRYGKELGVTQPKAEEIMTTMENRVEGAKGIAENRAAETVGARKALPPEQQADVLKAVENPKILDTPEPQNLSQRLNPILAKVQENAKLNYIAARESASNAFREVVEKEGIPGRAGSDYTRSTITDWLNGKLDPAKLTDTERLTLNSPKFQALKKEYSRVGKAEDIGKGIEYVQNPAQLSDEAMKIPTAEGQAMKMQRGQERIDAAQGFMRSSDEIKKVVDDATKITPQVILNPEQRKVYTKIREMRDETAKIYEDMARPMPYEVPEVQQGTLASRLGQKPALVPMAPKGGLKIDPDTGRLTNIQEINQGLEKAGKRPIIGDLDVLYGVGLKEAKEAKVVHEELARMADAVGKPINTKLTGNIAEQSFFDRTNLQKGYEMFTPKELLHLPPNFSGKQFPEEVVTVLRNGMKAGREGLFTSGAAQFVNGYMNSFRSWALTSFKYPIRNIADDSFRMWLAGTSADAIPEAAKILNGTEGFLNTAKGGKLAYKDINRLIQEYDVGSGFMKTEAGHSLPNALKETPITKGQKATDLFNKTIGPDNPLSKKVRDVAGSQEQYRRTVTFVDRLMKGDTIEEARTVVSKVNFDYTDLSTTMNKARNVLLFPGFTLKNIPFQVKAMAARPDKFALMNHVYNFFDHVDKDVPLDREIRAKWPLKVGNYYYLFGDFVSSGQLESIFQPFLRTSRGERKGAIVGGAVKDIAEGGPPVLAAALSAWANKEFSLDSRVEKYPTQGKLFMGVPIEKMYVPLLRAIPGLNWAFDMAKKGSEIAGPMAQEKLGLKLNTPQSPYVNEPPRGLPQRIVDTLVAKGRYDDPKQRLLGKSFDIKEKIKNLVNSEKGKALGEPDATKFNREELDRSIEDLHPTIKNLKRRRK